MHNRRLRPQILFVAIFCCGSIASSATLSPDQRVQELVDEVIALLKDETMEKMERRQKIRDALAPHFDFRSMSRSILALNWKKASAEQRERFIQLFKQLLQNTYIVTMEGYSGQTVRYGYSKTDGNRASVPTFIVGRNGVETPVTYRLRRKGDEWVAYDVIAEGVSLVSNYRTSFRAIARSEGMEVLLQQMAEKVAEQSQG